MLSKIAQRLALRSKYDTLYPAIDRIAYPPYKASFLKPIGDACNRAFVEEQTLTQIGKPPALINIKQQEYSKLRGAQVEGAQ